MKWRLKYKGRGDDDFEDSETSRHKACESPAVPLWNRNR